jgi:F0F1-type ATP synthase epsilon subunit
MEHDVEKLTVRVGTADSALWEGKADAVSSINSQGPFDILPEHAQMVTLVENHPIVIHNNTKTKEISFKQAVVHVHENTVSIYAAE